MGTRETQPKQANVGVRSAITQGKSMLLSLAMGVDMVSIVMGASESVS